MNKNIFLKISLIFTTFFLLGNTNLEAQLDNPPADLDGQSLRTWFKQNWYDGVENISTSASSGYRAARLEMYNKIDVVNGTLYGFYSGYEVNVPSQGFDAPGDISPMDCEHIVPQSLFNSSAPMKNDIFHLRPTYSNWNSTRSNLPFSENPDLETDKWMRFDDKIDCSGSASCIPDSDVIDEFSEVINGEAWEPREIVKGDVARSVFYFFTMYPQYSISSVGDVEELYEWHLQDPADEQEMSRNDMTEDYQGNRNPYIDNPEWVQRAWLPNLTPPVPSANANILDKQISVFPNPVKDVLTVQTNGVTLKKSVELVDVNGQILPQKDILEIANIEFKVDTTNLKSGVYFLKVETTKGDFIYKKILKQ